MLKVRWIQHAVGHGGFHTGHFEVPGQATFNWAFDCGSRRTAQFDDYLKTWARRSPTDLDWLFISHFDTDHVSGLDVLMSRTIVRNVMVPYLNEREFAYLLLHEIARDNLDRGIVEFTADPTGYFVTRGADRVVFLGAGGPPPEGGEPIEPREFPKDPDGLLRTKISPPPTPLPTAAMAVNGASLQAGQAQLIAADVCTIDALMNTGGLRLKPYRAPVSPTVLTGIIQAIQNLLGGTSLLHIQPGLGPLAFAVARHARTASGRAGLRSIYKQYVGSSNRASLSLLSIPLVGATQPQGWDLWHAHGSQSSWAPHSITPAWLNTGDAELLDPADLGDWKKAYGSDLAAVRALAIPHHGSDKNSDAALQALCPEATYATHARAGSKKHPGDAVVLAAGHRLASVTEEVGSELRMDYWAH